MVFSEAEAGLLKTRLLALQAELNDQQEIGRDAGETVELDQTSVGRLSRMDALQGQAMSKESGRRRGLSLQKVAAALVRLEKGEYGDCLHCGEQIPMPRLTFDPAATLCIECARKAET